ncbi:hypothetical protein ACNJ8R_004143 [Cronobacter sakazakii]|uniref:hypothetical protein n=1 Tax=Cronobacter sakazakii TaxID=28141 RepID=UPI0009BB6BD4|nr:hypothetical protein [Cronobacter sakazakii]EKY3179879.1 hypothetical protein [Cronobacter turicensis]ELY4007649.1 hypothetical protein [Cronobacter dublinensis]EJJ0671702.1 hypothetical protein [Cronobacter sakazakii]EJL7720580.1 hypothetical protein [Cronobacter sakazakii]EJV9557835.1 hypothetical protein [Cronobacter sakazakii]
MSHPRDWKFKRLKIDEDLINTIDNLAGTRGEQKADILGETIEWFVKNRSDGTLPPRYFVSPNDAPYTGLWLKPDTIRKIEELAQTDNQNPNRVIYTAIARFIERDKS